jgi:hypothetical protein
MPSILVLHHQQWWLKLGQLSFAASFYHVNWYENIKEIFNKFNVGPETGQIGQPILLCTLIAVSL